MHVSLMIIAPIISNVRHISTTQRHWNESEILNIIPLVLHSHEMTPHNDTLVEQKSAIRVDLQLIELCNRSVLDQ